MIDVNLMCPIPLLIFLIRGKSMFYLPGGDEMGCDALLLFETGEPDCSAPVNQGPEGEGPEAGNTCVQLGKTFLTSLVASA